MATYRGKIHGGKTVLGVHVARDKFGEITRFYCSSKLKCCTSLCMLNADEMIKTKSPKLNHKFPGDRNNFNLAMASLWATLTVIVLFLFRSPLSQIKLYMSIQYRNVILTG